MDTLKILAKLRVPRSGPGPTHSFALTVSPEEPGLLHAAMITSLICLEVWNEIMRIDIEVKQETKAEAMCCCLSGLFKRAFHADVSYNDVDDGSDFTLIA